MYEFFYSLWWSLKGEVITGLLAIAYNTKKLSLHLVIFLSWWTVPFNYLDSRYETTGVCAKYVYPATALQHKLFRSSIRIILTGNVTKYLIIKLIGFGNNHLSFLELNLDLFTDQCIYSLLQWDSIGSAFFGRLY